MNKSSLKRVWETRARQIKQAGNLKGRGGGATLTQGSEFTLLLQPRQAPPASADRTLVPLAKVKTVLVINQTRSWPKPSHQRFLGLTSHVHKISIF